MIDALKHLRSQGALVHLAGPGRLRCRVPAGRRDLVEYARQHKPALIAELRTEAMRRGEYDLPLAEPDMADVLRAWLEAGMLAALPPLDLAPGVRVLDAERAAQSYLLGLATGGRVAEADECHARRFIRAARPLLGRQKP